MAGIAAAAHPLQCESWISERGSGDSKEILGRVKYSALRGMNEKKIHQSIYIPHTATIMLKAMTTERVANDNIMFVQFLDCTE